MKVSIFAFLLQAVIFLMPFEALADHGALYLYEHPSYRGSALRLEDSGEISNLANKRKGSRTWNDVISSIYFTGDYEVTLYRDKNFRGPSIKVNSNTRDLARIAIRNWDNQVSSLSWTLNETSSDFPIAIFYDEPNYQGHSFILYGGDEIDELRDKRRGSYTKDWNDKIVSVKLIGGAFITLYEDDDFGGERITIIRNTPDLYYSGNGWDFRASSVSVY